MHCGIQSSINPNTLLLQKESIFRNFLIRNIYLLIIAAWLITFAIIIDNYWSPNSSLQSVQKKVNSYIHTSEKDFNHLLYDVSFLNAAADGKISDQQLQKLIQKKYFVFAYTIDSSGLYHLNLWNTNKILPSGGLLFLKGKSGFVQLQNGYYTWNSYQYKNIKILALFPVKWKYVIENEHLINGFAQNEISNEYDVTVDETPYPINSIHGNNLFYVFQKQGPFIEKNNIISVWLTVGALLLIFFFIHLVCSFISAHFGSWKGIVLLFTTMVIIRLMAYWYPFPINLRQFELYDPTIYGSSAILRSLGDLLVNALFLVWFILYLRTQVQEHQMRFLKKNPKLHWPLLIIGSLVIILFGYGGAKIVRSLVADSQISFDVLNFFTLNIYSVIGFIILCCIAISYFFLSQVIVHFIKPFFKTIIPLLLSMTSLGLILLTFRIGKIQGGLDVYILLWLIFFVYLLANEKFYLLASQIISSRLVFWLFFFSVSITSLIIVENKEKEIRSREHYAEKLSAKADPSTQLLINTMLTDFREDFLSKNYNKLTSPYLSNVFKDSLINNNISVFRDRFATKIYAFDKEEQPLSNPDSTHLNELNTIYSTQAKPTEIKDLYYYDVSYDRYNYISRKILKDTSGILLGTVFIVVSPNKDKNDALYPELFGRGRENAIENSSIYAFAIYNNWKLVDSHNDYSFATSLKKSDFPNQEFYKRTKDDFSEIWYNAGNGRMVVIARKNSLLIESITLFSYLFCAFLLLTLLFWIINVLLKARFHIQRLSFVWQFNIRNQIHGTIIFICAVSFFVIGIATILFFITRYENNNREQLSKAIHIMENEVKSYITQEWRRTDTSSLQKMGSGESIEKIINRISEIHGTDVNLYDLDGNLIVSSLPFPYTKGIISTIMEPGAFYHLNNLNEVQYFQKEQIGKLQYISNYIPVIDTYGNKYAYLNIPYFISETRLKAEISNFLVTIINLNAFIFLIAGIVALFITNRITSSFSLIADKMKRINIGQRNEAIKWTRNDEIGNLVVEYNKMVSKLEESAMALAKTERESAWREMAKQIAHEIKNPLTPMKLSMQYLLKSIEENQPNVKEMAAVVSKTLVEQIDHLSFIAGEFSQFANIENARLEEVNVHTELQNVLNLYKTDHRIQWNIDLVKEDIWIAADRTHLNRIFNNLLQNAIQASEGKPIILKVKEKIEGDQFTITISDSGSGIAPEIRNKIFTPNFTTKTSGTGLGLAMSKRMVEVAHGQIRFETEVEKGTSFFITFPILTH